MGNHRQTFKSPNRPCLEVYNKYLYFRAERFGEFLFSPEFKEARVPDTPYSLYEVGISSL